MNTRIRPAREQDQEAIRALVCGERLNPNGIHWPNFLVAEDHRGVVGAVQMRKHRDGSRELGSLVVAKEARGEGIAARLIDALIGPEAGRVQMVTGRAFASHYERWGFRRIAPRAASPSVRRNYWLGSLAFIISLVKRRRPQRLVILDRAGLGGTQRAA